MKKVILSSGDVCLVDDDDYDFVNQWRWKPIKSKKNTYAGRNIRGTGGKKWGCVLMHRLITDAPDGKQVDHINHMTLDNRRDNLRLCDQAHNNANSAGYSNRASTYKGVSRNGSNWVARIKKNGVCKCLGTFKTEEAAARVYDVAALEYFGDFAYTNFNSQIGEAS